MSLINQDGEIGVIRDSKITDKEDHAWYGETRDHVIVCLGGLTEHANGSPIFSCKVYGPFFKNEVEEKSKNIRSIEGGAILVRPLVDLSDTYRRLSAD